MEIERDPIRFEMIALWTDVGSIIA